MLSSNNHSFNIPSLFESLEDRVLFDGVPDATFILPQTDVDQPAPTQAQNVQPADIAAPRELILVDPGVEDSQQLLAEIIEGNPDSTHWRFEFLIVTLTESPRSASCLRPPKVNMTQSI